MRGHDVGVYSVDVCTTSVHCVDLFGMGLQKIELFVIGKNLYLMPI
jgi:hypothetical protein